MQSTPSPTLYGLMAEFSSPDELLLATRKAHAAGYRRMDAYTPIPVEGLSEAIGFRHTRLPLITLIGGIVGGLGGFAMQYIASVWHYPIVVAGRPVDSWMAFIPITFETTILFASFATVLGMLALNGLPMPYHPVFNVPSFALASRDRFFLCIETRDPNFDLERTRTFLREQSPLAVHEVKP